MSDRPILNPHDTARGAYQFRTKRHAVLDWIATGLTVSEACRAVGVSYWTVLHWMRRGEQQITAAGGKLVKGDEFAKFYVDYLAARASVECQDDWSGVPEGGLPIDLTACRKYLNRRRKPLPIREVGGDVVNEEEVVSDTRDTQTV